MAKPKHLPIGEPEWFAAEWLEYLGQEQTLLIKEYGRSKGRISELLSGKQRWNKDDLYHFSRILGVPRAMILDVNPMTPAGKPIAEKAGFFQAPKSPALQKPKKRT